MLISKYMKDWQDYLEALAFKCAGTDLKVHLLLDGVFSPGLHRRFDRISPSLLFENLPGSTDETRDVSPFLVEYAPTHVDYYAKRIAQCSAFPMISAIITKESQPELARRLAAWCIVEVDDQRFNFRFPDTRRLPRIYSVLTQEQRQKMTGPAEQWSFIARNGNWENLPLNPGESAVSNILPRLDAEQFSKLVTDSESDEISTILHDRGLIISDDPYLYHIIISQALAVSHSSSLGFGEKVDWCESRVLERQLLSDQKIKTQFSSWLKTQQTAN